jgi:DNA processing protein
LARNSFRASSSYVPLPTPDCQPDAWLTLDLIPGLGGEGVRALLKAFGGPREALDQSVSSLSRVVAPRLAQEIARGAQPEKLAAALKWLESPGNHFVSLADEDYPAGLLQISDPPPILFVKGRRELLGAQAIAVVGSRNATPQGLENAAAFSRTLSDAGLTIVSGMALGIDAAAHRGGLAGLSSSIAVVGTGLDLIYPAKNKALAHELADKGAIISEFSLGTPALAANFPRRNRIISGLSLGALVVEAALASGSLITARLAAEQGREVFAIPGSIHSPFSKGCHSLIKQGAKLVESAQDVLEELGLSEISDQTKSRAHAEGTKNTPEDVLLLALGFDPVGFDVLSERTDLAPEVLTAKLAEWEIAGVIAALPGGKYQRLS